MADQKVSALTPLDTTTTDPYNDMLYWDLYNGGTRLDRSATPFDLLVGSARKFSYYVSDMHKPDDGPLAQGTSNGGSIGASNATEVNHPGIYNLDTGGNAAGAAAIYTSNAFSFKVGGGIIRFISWMHSSGTLSNGTNRYGYIFGLSDDYFNFDPNNFIGIRYRDDESAGNWQLCCRNGGTETVQSIGVAYAINTWYRMQIDINATASSVTATVNGTTSSAVTTNISNTEMHLIAGIIKAIGTSARDVNLDVIGWMQNFTTAR